MDAGTQRAVAGAAWHIESIDYRAGMAFATWRPQRTAASPIASDEWPCLFFSPPNFSPESIGNISLAFSAFRGSFAPGPLVDGGEASFATPEQIAEFVRRSYVGSAGGDGAEGGDDGEAPPFPPVNPEMDDSSGKQSDEPRAAPQATLDFMRMLMDFDFAATSDTGATPFSWPIDTRADFGDSMVRGATLVVQELISRVPGWEGEQLYDWHAAMWKLGAILSRLGIWPGLLIGAGGTALEEALASLTQRTGLRDSRMVSLDIDQLLDALLSGLGPDDDYFVHRYYRGPLRYVPRAEGNALGEDPVQLLRDLPLPRQFLALAASDLARRASLLHLLSAFFSSPQAVTRAAGHDTVALVLFCCGCMTSAGGRRHGITNTESYFPSTNQRIALERASAAALRWMLEHMPKFAYPPELEDAIAKAKLVRY